MTEEMYNELPSRRDIITEAVNNCLDYMYQHACPSITLDQLGELVAKEPNSPFHERYYLPEKEHTEIMNMFMEAYNIESKFHDYVDLVIDDLKKGPTKDVWIEKEGYPGYRGYEQLPPITDLIPKENFDKVLEYINTIKNFYLFNRDEQAFIFNVANYSPCSNKDTVEKYWQEHGKPDFKIDENQWNDDIDNEESE